jgi:phage/plasmid-associated DNA primase
LGLGTLFYYAKQDNPESYKNMKISNYIQKQKDTFPDNNLVITNIVNKGHTCYAELSDDYCPFIQGTHNDKDKTMYVEVNGSGLCLKCKKCPFEILPIEGHIKLPNNTLQTVFGIENVYNNVTINNNYDSASILETFAIHKSEYDVFEDKTLNELVYLSLNGTGFKIAELVYYLYKDRFNCTVNKSNNKIDNWYEFKNHRWRLGAPVMFKLISADVTKYHVKLLDFYSDIKTKNKLELEHIQCMKKVITNIIKNLETTSFKNSIMQDICTTFYLNNKDFENNLDKKGYLIGFENGVYDLEKYEFRDGRPDDNITMSVGYDYVEEHTKYKDDLFKFLEDILPDENDRDFLLKYTATGLTAYNKEEIAVILSGNMRNGKTKYKDLVDMTLGQYFVTFTSELLTMPRPAPGCPAPELMAFINKRFGLGSEPGANDKINTGFYKFFIGNETYPARGLYDKTIISINPTHKIGILCNKIPAFDDNNDPAVWARTRCIEFPITFVNDPKNPNEKKIDKTIGEKLKLWKQDFMLLLIKKYKCYCEEGLIETKSIMKFTQNYKESNDTYLQYLEERTEKSDKHIHTSVLYADFKNWFAENNPRTKIPSNRVFVANLRNHLVLEQVRVNNKNTLGIKCMQLIDPIEFDII